MQHGYQDRHSVLDLLDELTGERLLKTAVEAHAYLRQERDSWDQRPLHAGLRRKIGVRASQQRSALDEEIAAYAHRHGGRPDSLDLDPALEAASLEHWLDVDGTTR